jgi:Zn finger protein HypA/HybF involved in hydrogenase expression
MEKRDLNLVPEATVVRGKWKPIFKGADTCECSVCKSEGFSDSDFGFIATPYCPNCGAKMEVE